MKRTMLSIICAVIFLVGSMATAQPPVPKLKEHVRYLASSKLEGRDTGSNGEALAAEYIIKELKAIGAMPLPGLDDFRIPFGFTSGIRDKGSTLTITDPNGESVAWLAGIDFQALGFSDSRELEGELVFAGYGITTPDSQDFSYDSYHGLDVEDKIVVVFRYYPEDADIKIRNTLARYSMVRYKAMRARELGAKGLIVVTGPRSPNGGRLMPLSFDTALSRSGIVAGSITGKAAKRLFESSGDQTLAELQKSFDSGNPHVSGFNMEGFKAKLKVDIEREKDTGYNVAGYLPSENRDYEYVILGAHYDHLGYGRGGGSLARNDEHGEIHFGADDNASGVAAVIEVGRLFATRSEMRERPVVLAFWSGEEMGLLGSADFLDKEVIKTEDIAAYLNFDMVGRSENNSLTIQAVGSSSVWKGLIEQANVPVGFDLSISEDPWVPSDSSSFNEKKIPSIMFFTGSHEDYHRPSDTPEKLNYEGLGRLVHFSALMTRKLLLAEERPDFQVVERNKNEGAGRAGMRAYTGTIPDYTAEVEGLRLSGVASGGPADKAGLKEGDIIVGLAGLEIKNIYDYTYALDAVKIGEKTDVIYMREGERLETIMIPEARN